MGFANKEMTCLEAKVEKVTQERDDSVARAEKLSSEVRCVLGLSKKAKKLRKRVSTLETVAHANVSKVGKSPILRSKQKKSDTEAEIEQACVKLGAWNAHVPESEARSKYGAGEKARAEFVASACR